MNCTSRKQRCFLAAFLLLIFPGATTGAGIAMAQTSSKPTSTVDVGDTPVALSLLPDGRGALVVNLYPEPANSANPTNVKVVDYISAARKAQFRLAVAKRLIACAISSDGKYALFVNEDDDRVYFQRLSSIIPSMSPEGSAQPGIPEQTQQAGGFARVGSRPSNIAVISPALAIVTNGTSGDVSFLKLDFNNPDPNQQLTVQGNARIGSDPRAVAVHPTQPYAYVALGGDNAVGVLDLTTLARIPVTGPGTLNGNVLVGKNPVALATYRDSRGRSRVIVTNVTNSTVAILDLSDARAPRVLPSPAGFFQLAVGAQPGGVAVTQDGRFAYITGQNINYFTAVDLEKQEVAGIVSTESGTSGISISPDGKWLLVAELKNAGRLLIFDLGKLTLAKTPLFDVPGEPGGVVFMGTDPAQPCPGFYIAEVQLAEGARSGFWGMEVLAVAGDRLLQGGFNLGGGFDSNGGNPGFGAFNIANPGNESQNVRISVQAQALSTPGFRDTDLGLSVKLLQQRTDGSRIQVGNGASGRPPLNIVEVLGPGFYIVEMRSLSNSPRGTYQMALETSLVSRPGGGFQGGVVVGGYMTRNSQGQSLAGFGAFCIAQSQDISVRVFGSSLYADAAAGDLILTLRDRNKNPIRVIDNSIPAEALVAPPPPPDTLGAQTTSTVNATAALRPAGDCDRSRKFRSLSAAIQCAADNEVIRVEAGIYSPSLTGEIIPIGSPGPGIRSMPPGVRIIGAGASTTILDAEKKERDGNGNAIVVPGGSHRVRIAGMTIRNSIQGGILVASADNVLIDRNYLSSNSRVGIGSISARGLVLKENVTVSNEESGIIVAGSLPTAAATSGAPAECGSNFGACLFSNTANDNRADGILGSQGGSLVILRNITVNNGSSGIELNNRSDGPANPELVGTLLENTVSNNGGKQFGFAGTGILITEGARAQEISRNTLLGNRPYGIGIFLNGAVDLVRDNRITRTQLSALLVQRQSVATEISGNTIINNGLAGIFVENQARVTRLLDNTVTGNGTCTECTFSKAGLAVLEGSTVDSAARNHFDDNYTGMEIAGSSKVSSITDSTFDRNSNGGVLIRESSTLTSFHLNKIRNNFGLPGFQASASTGTLSGSEISDHPMSGLTFTAAARFTLQDNLISGNNRLNGGSDGGAGIQLDGGSELLMTGNTLTANLKNGMLAAGAGTRVTLNSGNSISNNLGFGVSAYQGAVVECRGSNAISGNSSGNKVGNVTGCP